MYILWNLLRRRVTWRLTGLQTMCTVLKYRKTLYIGLRYRKTFRKDSVRCRFGSDYFFTLSKFSSVLHFVSTGLCLLQVKTALCKKGLPCHFSMIMVSICQFGARGDTFQGKLAFMELCSYILANLDINELTLSVAMSSKHCTQHGYNYKVLI